MVSAYRDNEAGAEPGQQSDTSEWINSKISSRPQIMEENCLLMLVDGLVGGIRIS